MYIVSYFTTGSGRSPVETFIEGEPIHPRDKLYEMIEHLRVFGFQLPNKYLRRMAGTQQLWELRVKYNKQYRIFLAKIGEQEIVLLHAIIKKRQKTPDQDIRTAQERLRLLYEAT